MAKAIKVRSMHPHPTWESYALHFLMWMAVIMMLLLFSVPGAH